MPAAARWTRPGFRGDPLPLATAAPAGSISQSWTGTKTGPVLLDVSAYGITCADVDRPWLRGEFKWTLQQETSVGSGTFNDVASGSGGLTNPVSSAAAEVVAGVYGPRHSFRLEPATQTSYRAKCVARFLNDTNDGYETATYYGTAVTVNLVADGDKRYAASTGSSGGAGTVGDPKDIPTFANGLQYRVVDTVSLTTAFNISGITAAQVVSNSSSARMTLTSTGTGLMLTQDTGTTAVDIVFQRIVLDAAGEASAPISMLVGSGSNGLFFDDCEIIGGDGVVGIGSGTYTAKGDRVGFWDTVFDGTAIASGSDSFICVDDWMTMAGVDCRALLENPGGVSLDHCYYINNDGDDHLLRWVTVSEYVTTGGNGFFFNLNYPGPASTFTTRYYIADCDVTGTGNGIDVASSDNTWANYGGFQDVLIEGCAIHNIASRGLNVVNVNPMQVRDCVFWDIVNSHIAVTDHDFPDPNPTTLSVVRCKFYRAASGENFEIIGFERNLQNAHEIRDCVFQDMRTQPIVLSVRFDHIDDMVAAGAQISGNVIYAPNDTSGGKYIKDALSGDMKTIAEFETAAGLSGTFTVANPDWVDPANGDFRTRAEATVQKTLRVRASGSDYVFTSAGVE
jgi:hypothetical protein